MSNQRIVFQNTDGTVAVVIPAPGFTVQDCIKDVPAGAAHEIVDTTVIPTDRTFRNAWKHDPVKKVDVDMVKAKNISHDRRRTKRAAQLAPLDIEATIPSKANAAENARQVIRDQNAAVQAEMDACTTPEQLKAILVREAM